MEMSASISMLIKKVKFYANKRENFVMFSGKFDSLFYYLFGILLTGMWGGFGQLLGF